MSYEQYPPRPGSTPGEQPLDPAEPGGWSLPQQFASGAPQPDIRPYQVPGVLPDHPQATLILVLGIAGAVTAFFGFPFIAPVAWYLGGRAQREIRSYPPRYRRSGAVTAGYILGILGTLVATFIITALILGVLIFTVSR